MITINNITEADKYLDDIELVIFDLDDTLYSEKDYVRSGYIAAAPDKADDLWQAFLDGTPAFDVVMPERKKEALAIYRNHIPNIELYSGVRDMLNRIKESGKHLAMITDGRPEGQRAKIHALGIEPLFDEIIITDELGGVEYRKPNAVAFELMHEKFEVPYEKMVYIGDNPKKDFIAPEKLGMRAIYFINEDGLYR